MNAKVHAIYAMSSWSGLITATFIDESHARPNHQQLDALTTSAFSDPEIQLYARDKRSKFIKRCSLLPTTTSKSSRPATVCQRIRLLGLCCRARHRALLLECGSTSSIVMGGCT